MLMCLLLNVHAEFVLPRGVPDGCGCWMGEGRRLEETGGVQSAQRVQVGPENSM